MHQAVLASGARETGATVHLVDEVYDRGAVLAQARVPVLPGDTAEQLWRRGCWRWSTGCFPPRFLPRPPQAVRYRC